MNTYQHPPAGHLPHAAAPAGYAPPAAAPAPAPAAAAAAAPAGYAPPAAGPAQAMAPAPAAAPAGYAPAGHVAAVAGQVGAVPTQVGNAPPQQFAQPTGQRNFAGIEGAKASFNANYLTPGKYWVLVKACKQDISQNSGPFASMEFVVIRVIDNNMGQGHRRGDTIQDFNSNSGKSVRYFLPNIKAFITAATGYTDAQISEAVVEQVFGPEQPLASASVVLELHGVQKYNKDTQQPYTIANYVRSVPYTEVLGSLGPEVCSLYFTPGHLEHFAQQEQAGGMPGPEAYSRVDPDGPTFHGPPPAAAPAPAPAAAAAAAAAPAGYAPPAAGPAPAPAPAAAPAGYAPAAAAAGPAPAPAAAAAPAGYAPPAAGPAPAPAPAMAPAPAAAPAGPPPAGMPGVPPGGAVVGTLGMPAPLPGQPTA